MRKITKLFQTKAQSINEQTKTVRFKISDNQTDRMGEKVDQATWDFKNYMQNPIVLWGHNPDEPENVLGTTRAVEVQGDETYAEMSFDDDINPKASLVWKQILKGTLRTVSVGFISKRVEGDTLFDNELLEVSVVPIPANPRAIALSYQAGEMSRKDANWLKESMAKEIEHLEQQLSNEEEEVNTKDAAELNSKLDTVLDAIGQLGDKVNAVASDVAVLQASSQTDDDQTDDEDAADAQAASEEQTDASTEQTDTENDDDSAKGGETDQSGAETDDIDLDAELTPELEAQLDEQLATADQEA